MFCEHCHQNEATVSLHMNVNGHTRHLHLCPQCAGTLEGQYLGPMGAMPWPLGGLFAPQPAPAYVRPHAARPDISGELDPQLSSRRQLSALRARLDAALKNEHYEEAIELRDQIKGLDNPQ